MSTDPQADYDALLTRGPWVIRRVEIDNAEDGLRLGIAAAGAGKAATLRFTGVMGLEFRQESGDLPLGLQIVDMTADGWEGIRWRVTDPEYGIASFWSADFSIDAT
jgi:hypothetical protein